MSTSLSESSLSRLYRHNLEHDCGAITAFRHAADCGRGAVYSTDDNRKRNRSLLAKLQQRGFSVTSLHGRYPEAGVTRTEESYFVADLRNRGTLEHDLRSLGETFDQDSVLFIPAGAIAGTARAHLIGTNHCSTNWIAYGERHTFDVGRLGHESPMYTSYVNGRPFIFEDVGLDHVLPSTGFGWWGVALYAKKHWTEFD